jgi:hypothetical protein
MSIIAVEEFMKQSQIFCPSPLKVAIFAMVSSCFYAPFATADVYKCMNHVGKTEFSDAPCSAGSAGKTIGVKPNVVDMSEQREQSLKAENQMLKDKLAANQADSSNPRANNNSDSSRIDSAACRTAKHDYEITASSIEKNSAMLRVRESAMYGACGLREPDRTNINIKTELSGTPTYLVPTVPRSSR